MTSVQKKLSFPPILEIPFPEEHLKLEIDACNL